MPEQTPAQPDARQPIRRALVSVYDKSGLEELAQALHEAGVALVSTGSTAGPDRRRRRPGDPGRGAHRLPRVPRRPGEDAAPDGARRHPGRPPPRVPPRPAPGARRRAVRPGRVEPVPLHRDRGERRGARRVRRADRHRRTVDGAGRREEPPVRRDRHLARPVRRAAGRRARGRHDAGPAQGARGRCVRAHRDVRRGRGVLDGQRAHRLHRRHRLPGLGRGDLGQGGGAALRREPAPARRALHLRARGPRERRAAARQGDVLQQLRRHRRRPPGGQRLRRAPRSRSSSTPTRAGSRSAPTWPRRTARRTPATRSPPSAA